jgi:hypothetical protein
MFETIMTSREDTMAFRLVMFSVFILTVAIVRFTLRKSPRPLHILERIKLPHFLRLSLVLVISSPLLSIVRQMFDGRWTYFTECVSTAFMALIFVLPALFCFVDMTKKQIAISAIIPTIYYIIYGMRSCFFMSSFKTLDIFPMEYPVYMHQTIGLLWYPYYYINSIWMFYPFIFVLLARSKKDMRSDFQGFGDMGKTV